MNIDIENDFQQKIMVQSFKDKTVISDKAHLLTWRQLWLDALKSWHSPYKLVIDCTNLSVENLENKAEVQAEWAAMIKFFQGFFLKSVVGFGGDSGLKALAPFELLATADQAFAKAGLRKRRATAGGDFRSQIQLENHFQTHTVELSFGEMVQIKSDEQLAVLKSKLTNNLMQWHSKWNLLIDCQNLEINPALTPQVLSMLNHFKGFFLKKTVGYGKKAHESFPFPLYRARHRAAAILESEGAFSGDEADCRSRKP